MLLKRLCDELVKKVNAIHTNDTNDLVKKLELQRKKFRNLKKNTWPWKIYYYSRI